MMKVIKEYLLVSLLIFAFIIGIGKIATIIHELGHYSIGNLFGVQSSLSFINSNDLSKGNLMSGIAKGATSFDKVKYKELESYKRVGITLAGPVFELLFLFILLFIVHNVNIKSEVICSSLKGSILILTLLSIAYNFIPLDVIFNGEIIGNDGKQIILELNNFNPG